MSNSIKLSRRSFLVMTAAVAACKPGVKALDFTGTTMGTTYNVIAIDTSGALNKAEAQTKIDAALALVNKQMSNWDPASEISRFNAGTDMAAFAVSPELGEVMTAAEAVHVASQGRFDTTMGPLIEAWGFGKNGATSMPSADQLAAAQAISGHGATLTVGPNSLQKTQAGAQVYLSAIGKGYGADLVGRALEGMGVTDYMVEIGGDLYAAGLNANGMPWQIGIEKPVALSGGVYDVVAVSGLGLASSGDYRNYFEQDGVRYSHIIDPVTGRPITHKTASATVLAENAMLADAWATAMLIVGRERGLEVAEQENLAVLFVDGDTSGAQLGFTSTASARFAALTS